VLDARAAARPELGGVERWARELAARLPALAPGRYRVARPPAAFSHRAGHLWEQVVLPARAARERAPLLLCPANLAPLAFPRNAVVIHDAAPLREPAWYSPAYVAWQRAALPRIARRARLVITVSAFSRGELAALLGLDAGRVRVVPGGVDARFAPDADPAPARAALGLARPYVLTVASRTARKNLGALEEAARRLAAGGIELVAAGGDRPQFRAGRQASAVRALGHVPDEHLPGLYAGAAAFVLPSRYEGFGLTCLEAMACGVPVVAARAGALPETCGDAALYGEPDDPASFADALERALGADGARLRAAGPARARAYGWERTARAVDALVAAAAGEPR
ncbi:MAG TPA: glycosyltransferase family 1 protein, partial [Solirubrobacteraceae bacterium]|nr:glycosyltransferase family 1 protein [Solirubrobacteraceae bacterium]